MEVVIEKRRMKLVPHHHVERVRTHRQTWIVQRKQEERHPPPPETCQHIRRCVNTRTSPKSRSASISTSASASTGTYLLKFSLASISTMPPTTQLQFAVFLFSLPSPDPGELFDGQSVDPFVEHVPLNADDPVAVVGVIVAASFPASLPKGDSDSAPDNDLDPGPEEEPTPDPDTGDAGTLLAFIPTLLQPNSSPANKPDPNNPGFEAGPDTPAVAVVGAPPKPIPRSLPPPFNKKSPPSKPGPSSVCGRPPAWLFEGWRPKSDWCEEVCRGGC